MVSSVWTAEYEVRKGNTLTKIAELTNHTVSELIRMNKIKNPDLIMVEQKIIFIGKEDLDAAKLWCQRQVESQKLLRIKLGELGSILTKQQMENRKFFEGTIQDIDDLKIRHSLNESSGTHYSIILSFADAWRSR